MSLHGSCLCGGVKVEVQGDPFRTNLCHCSSCQKSTGAVFGSFAAYNIEQVTLTESEPSVLKTYSDTSPESGAVLNRSFCGKCGSPVNVTTSKAAGTIVLPVGIIDGDKAAFKPELEFYCKGRANWVSAVEDSTTFETMPPTPPAANQ
ncbi:glutathione-dependent formaldehyde-activating, GFA [Xylaria cf. heliscus]|nr:glutathione-dependent formaldehyde-activating, GFA [Xylaria cf. heliscus]